MNRKGSPPSNVLDEDPHSSDYVLGGHYVTETINLNNLLTEHVTTSGSFNLRDDIWSTTFGKVIQALPIPVLLIDHSHNILVANQAWGRIATGYEKILGNPFAGLFTKHSVALKGEALVGKVFSSRKTVTWKALLDIGNSKAWVRFTFRPIRVKDQRFLLVMVEDLSLEKKQLLLERKYKEEFKRRIEERTQELRTKNEELAREIEDRRRSEKALKESEERFKAIFESHHAVLLVIDPETGRIEDASPGACAFYGYNREELKGKNITDINILSPEQVRDRMQMAKSLDRKYFDFQHRLASGEVRDVEACSGPIAIAGKTLLFSVINDVTERKRAEELLQESEKRYRLLFENAGESICVMEAEGERAGQIVSANPAAAKMHGYTVQELLSLNIADLDTPESARSVAHRLDRLLRGEEVVEETTHRRKDGSVFPVEIHPRLLDLGSHKCVVAIDRDITERKRSEEALRATSAYNRRLIEASLDPLVTVSSEGEIIDVNTATENVTGYSRDELIGTHYSIYFTDPETAKSGFQQVFRDGSVKDYELEIRHKDGRLTPVMCNASLYRDESGNIVGVFAAARDITDRKRAEEELLRQKEELQLVLDSVPAWIYYKDVNNHIIRANKTSFQAFGYTESDVIGKSLDEFLPIEIAAEMYSNDLEVIAAKQPKTDIVECLEVNGKPTTLLTNKIPVQNARGDVTGIIGVSLDITERKYAEDRLRESEERFRAVFNNDHAVMLLIDPETGNIVDASPGACTYYGYDRELIRKKKITEINALSSEETFETMSMASTQQHKYFDFRHRLASGEVRDVEVCSGPIVVAGKILLFSIITDVTDRKRAEESLQAANRYNRSLIEASLDPLVTISAEGKITDVNTATERVTGHSRQKLIGTDVADYFTDPEKARAGYQKAFESGSVTDYELEIRHKTGNLTPVMYNASVYHDHLGKVAGLFAAARDITERKLSDELIHTRLDLLEYAATHSLEEVLQKTLDEIGRLTNSPLGFYHFVSEDEKAIYLQAWSTRTMKEFCATEGKGRHYPVDQAGVWADCIRERRPIVHNDYSSLPNRRGSREGHAAVIRELVVPVMKSERIVAILGIGNKPQDYTDKEVEVVSYLADVSWEIAMRKQTEANLDWSEKRYRFIEESTRLGMAWIDPDFKIRMMNAPMSHGHYKPLSEHIGKECFRVFEKRDAVCPHCPGVRTMCTGEPAEAESQGTRADGSRFHVTLRTFPSKGRDGAITGFIEIVEDVTEQKQKDAALRESEQQYRTLFEDSIDGVYSVRWDGTIMDANSSFCGLFGYTKDQIIGKNIAALYLDPADNTRLQKKIEEIRYVRDYEVKLLKKDGAEVDCMLTSSVLLEKDGGTRGYRGIVRDLTASKAMQRQLFQAQKMEAVGTLAGGIAHDFNNLLQVTLGFSELLLSGKSSEDVDYPDLQKIHQASLSGIELVRSLLTFSRKSEPQSITVDLNNVIEQVEKLLRRTMPKTIEIRLDLQDNLVRINADPIQLEQILINLAVNGKDAMGESGCLTIKTETVTLGEEYCRFNIDAKPGDYVMLSVSDTGHGMDKKTLQHIFEPFFTTKEVGRGTGLGLAMVYGIVKQHGGHIDCYSEVGKGTVFKVCFPALPFVEEHARLDTDSILAFGTETVLLVDDEESVRELGARILSRQGYTVLQASNGEEAVDVFKKERSRISLVILDLNMPVMGGKDCLKCLLDLDPHVKALISSGYSRDASAKERIEMGARGFVDKPFRFKALLQQVRKVLDES